MKLLAVAPTLVILLIATDFDFGNAVNNPIQKQQQISQLQGMNNQHQLTPIEIQMRNQNIQQQFARPVMGSIGPIHMGNPGGNHNIGFMKPMQPQPIILNGIPVIPLNLPLDAKNAVFGIVFNFN